MHPSLGNSLLNIVYRVCTNRVFCINLNSAEKIEWAAELIREFELHSKSGKGAFTFKGQMIDMPLVKQANNILQFA